MYLQRIKRRLPATLVGSLLFAACAALCLTTFERRAAAFVARAATSSLLQAPVHAAPSSTRKLNGRIAYVSRASSDPRSSDIWVMNADGSGATNLTNTPQTGESSPAWSPDGTRLAFARGVDDLPASELFLMNADGSNATRVPIASGGHSPAWSPDGTRLAYVVTTRDNNSDIYVANLDGSGQLKLTNSVLARELNPTWSPDGSYIAFDRDPQTTGGGIFVLQAIGGGERKIVDASVVIGAHHPRWSPDGRLIMFEGGAFTAPGPAAAYVVSPEGGTPTTLYSPNTPRPPIYDPAWSPDGKSIVFRNDDEANANIGKADLGGKQIVASLNAQPGIQSQPAWQPLPAGPAKIVFTSERDGNAEIYVMDADGKGQTNLTNHPAKDATPAWSPDGTQIAFTSDRSGRSNIYVMDADGQNVRAVTNIGNDTVDYRVYDPAWSPDGSKLVFVGSFMGETSTLLVVNADGSGELRAIREGSSEVADPDWSPDGTRIAYIGREGFFNPEDGIRFFVFVVNADGTGKTRVSPNPLPFDSFAYPPTASGPTWSPDATHIAFSGASSLDGSIPQIIQVQASGGSHISVTSHPSAHTQPDWTADNRILFTNDRDGQREIYSIDVNGSFDRPVTRLTQNAAADYDPDAQPDVFVPQRPISTIQWRGSLFRVREGGAATGGDPLIVTRLGDVSQAATVDFETTDIPCLGGGDCPRRASERSDYLRTSGTLHFAPGEASKTIHVPLVDDVYVEGDQFYDLVLSNPIGAMLGAQSGTRVIITDNDTADAPPAANPIDEPNFFVRMHYLDFLGREPEPAGQQAWVNVWTRCPDINRDERCDRVTISSAFFRSLEFQMRGFFVYRFYRASFNRRPTYAEFVRDMARINGQTLAEIDASKNAFAEAFVRREDFRAAHFGAGVPGGDYVARLEANTGTTLTGDVTRATLEADLREGRRTHAGVLRAVVEHPNVEAAHYNEAFVTMQYFGYLKRDPEEEGFQNWMRVINRGDGYRVMVHGFVNSVEYRARFGKP